MERSSLFIETLIKKLKSGDSRSIHLDALPGRYARLDLYDLVNVETSAHHDFVRKLLSGKSFSFTVQISPDKWKGKPAEEQQMIQKIIRRLNHLYYQEQDEFAEMGTLSFGFGYPLLIFRDPSNPGRILKAPLAIWYLQLEKDTRFSNTWTIKRTDEHPILFNEVLKAHVESTSGIRWSTPLEWDDENPLDEVALKKLIGDVLSAFHVQPTEEDLFVKVMPCTNRQTLDQLTEQHPWIRWSGIFGLYKTQKQAIIQDLIQLSRREETKETFEKGAPLTQDALTPVTLDPSQETVLHHINEHGRIIIQGPPGTGKSQSISAIITSALLEGRKVLVVCEKRTALEVIKNNLESLGLGELLVLIEDVYADRNQVVQRVRKVLDGTKEQLPYFRNHAFEFSRKKILESRAALNKRISVLHERIFGDDSWLELAERHSEILSRLDPKFKLPQIEISHYRFSYEDWAKLSQKISEDHRLLDEVSEASKVSELFPSKYWMDLNDETWKQTFPKIVEVTGELVHCLESNYRLFGAAFYDISKTAIAGSKLAGLFSGRHKALNQARMKAKELYSLLFDLLEGIRWPEHGLKPPVMESNMMHWPTAIKSILNKTEKIAPFYTQIETVRKWIDWLSKIPVNIHPVMASLCRFEHPTRIHALDEWYFRNFLEQYAKENAINQNAEFHLLEYSDHEKVIHPLLVEKILHDWRSASRRMLQGQDAAERRMLYNLRKNKQFSSRNTLRTILSRDFDFFSTVFPVMMLNPVTASAILPLKKDLFDVIVLDEASQLRVEDTYAALYRGKRHIISGDEHQMPPSSWFNSEILLWEEQDDGEEVVDQFLAGSASLLEYASDAGYIPTYLDFHYRSKHPDLIAFSNAGFYGSRLVPMPPKTEYQAMHFNPVDGVYANGTNQQEARAIVDFVYKMASSQNGEMPGVGIGTLNIYQRDLIQDMLWEAAFADQEKSRLLEQLVNAGLFVKNLDNIQGDERDIIIIGTTFGPDQRGNFRQNFGPLNRENGYQLLNVLITRAKKEMHVFTSIPESTYLHFEEELSKSGNTGKALLYAYLSYVRAAAGMDRERKEYILDFLRKNSRSAETANLRQQTRRLPSFVANAIRKVMDANLEESTMIGGFNLEGTLDNGYKKIYLQTEYPSSHPSVHYREFLYRPSILKTFNFQTQRIWTYDWWKEPEKAVELLRI